MKLVNIGSGNMVSAERIVTILTPESAPIKRIIQDAKEQKVLIDATMGRKTKTVIVRRTNLCIGPGTYRRGS